MVKIIFIRLGLAIFVWLIAQGVNLTLEKMDYYPTKWLFVAFGVVKERAATYPEASYIMVGLFGLIGFIFGPVVVKYVAIRYGLDRDGVWGQMTPVGIQQEPPYIKFETKAVKTFAGNNIRNLSYNGNGEYSIDFLNPLEGDWDVKSDNGTAFTVLAKTADSITIRLENEETETVVLSFRRRGD